MPAVQPCTLLLLVGSDWQIETISANAAMLGDYKSAALISQPLADLIGSKAIHALRNRLAWLSSDESEVHDFGVKWGDVTLDIRARREEDLYLIEAELAVEPRLPDGIGMVRSMTDRLASDQPREIAEQAMRQLAALTGFDRLMFCNREGQLIAANEHSHGSGTGWWNVVEIPRLVADRDAEPVPLLGDETHKLLRQAAFLAPDSREQEGLTRASIAATMSLPLRIDGELVGVVHAGHGVPHRCGAERRSVAHLFAERLAARMARHGWRP